jgi:hypothetical protein
MNEANKIARAEAGTLAASADADILMTDVSDQALEFAVGFMGHAAGAFTVSMCTGLQECPY